MTRRRGLLGLAAVGAVSAGALVMPSAEAAPNDVAVTEGEWACLAVGEIDLGLCLDNPIPDIGDLPTVPELVADILALLR